MRIDAEYVLPLRWHDDRDLVNLTAYLRRLSTWIDVTVVDGSEPRLFRRHAEAWGRDVRHVRPTPTRGANGKVVGVLTGLSLARHEVVVLADDDVRHTPATLAALRAEIEDADLVAPQNVFRPHPWHARWDTARSLVNRAFAADYPGTYALRRSALRHGYDPDALFENCEMERTVRAGGGRVHACRDLYIDRRPPTVRHFWAQRVRQAYDSQAQPLRLCLELAIVPTLFALRRRRGILALLAPRCGRVGRVRAAPRGRTCRVRADGGLVDAALGARTRDHELDGTREPVPRRRALRRWSRAPGRDVGPDTPAASGDVTERGRLTEGKTPAASGDVSECAGPTPPTPRAPRRRPGASAVLRGLRATGRPGPPRRARRCRGPRPASRSRWTRGGCLRAGCRCRRRGSPPDRRPSPSSD